MGANLTTEHETNGSPTKKGGQVIVFHSSTKWRNFEASKQASKLLLVVDLAIQFNRPPRRDFIQIDVDELHDVAEEFRERVMPSLMLLKRGKVIDKVVGAKREDLQKKIEKHRF